MSNEKKPNALALAREEMRKEEEAAAHPPRQPDGFEEGLPFYTECPTCKSVHYTCGCVTCGCMKGGRAPLPT